MKKIRILTVIMAASLSAVVAGHLPHAVAQVSPAETMADIYQPYFEHVDATGEFAEQVLLSEKPLPKGTVLSFPHHGGQTSTGGSHEVAKVSETSDYYVFAPRSYEDPYIYWQKWDGQAYDFTTHHFAIKVTVTYPDMSTDVIDSSVSMTPDMRMVHQNGLRYSRAWVADGETTTVIPTVNTIPKSTKVEYEEDSYAEAALLVQIEPETFALQVTPLSGFWDMVERTNSPLIHLHVIYEDGSRDLVSIPIDPVGSRPEPAPEPQPEPSPEPVPEPKPTPTPKPTQNPKNSTSSFLGSSF